MALNQLGQATDGLSERGESEFHATIKRLSDEVRDLRGDDVEIPASLVGNVRGGGQYGRVATLTAGTLGAMSVWMATPAVESTTPIRSAIMGVGVTAGLGVALVRASRINNGLQVAPARYVEHVAERAAAAYGDGVANGRWVGAIPVKRYATGMQQVAAGAQALADRAQSLAVRIADDVENALVAAHARDQQRAALAELQVDPSATGRDIAKAEIEEQRRIWEQLQPLRTPAEIAPATTMSAAEVLAGAATPERVTA